jgi:hypothetical protein
MVDQPIEVDVQIAGRDVPAGRLWAHRHGRSESATFSYREDYLQLDDAYALDPEMPLQTGQHQTPVNQPLSTAGWSLSPAFDLNPNPEGVAKQLTTAIDGNNTEASLATALEVAGLFRIAAAQARAVVAEVLAATGRWRDVAQEMGLGGRQLERLEPAFEHEQSAVARELVAASH